MGLLGVYTTESALFNATEVEPIPLNSGILLTVGAESWRDIQVFGAPILDLTPTSGLASPVSSGRTAEAAVRVGADRTH